MEKVIPLRTTNGVLISIYTIHIPDSVLQFFYSKDDKHPWNQEKTKIMPQKCMQEI